MIDVKFAVETKDGNWFENINSIEECFSHDIKKIYARGGNSWKI